jgi:hypothetical protein
MNYCKACDILDLSEIFCYKELRHQYYIKALLYHPDKNTNLDTTKKFQEVLDAYNYLNKCCIDKNDMFPNDMFANENFDDNINKNDNNYFNILEKFLNSILNQAIDIKKFVSLLNNKYSDITIELLKNFSKGALLKLNKFINEYSNILYINKDILDKFNDLIKEYIKNDLVEIINPTLDNLINNDIYKFDHNSEIYYIPMWHHELVYELSNNLLIVKCEPDLPDFISLDQYNNLYVNLSTEIKSILSNDNIIINIGEKKCVIPVNKLYIKHYQRYCFNKEGISLIDPNNIYNIEDRGNIYVDIYFTDIK